ncbi:hypothetical protein PAXRUDRAFT_829032 [Paxillus rubicundulus Ve08.2h10]|uniref:Uncharacterized protein n=1 Tax=Paxillus rubicundulus Ve08.2h10 TaxID=930991 RepID=A0A0D0DNG0_9AGAM|nr:hypothetical protein PAXRUDRAFT_829032 [Paxillus rubicundulus Ve08.2h10]
MNIILTIIKHRLAVWNGTYTAVERDTHRNQRQELVSLQSNVALAPTTRARCAAGHISLSRKSGVRFQN